MEITLHTEGWFDASHHLKNYEGKCNNQHGHTYKIEVWTKGAEEQLQDNGILWDFGYLKQIIEKYDHRNLDDLYECNSTAENQALNIYRLLKDDFPRLRFKVRLYEQLSPKESYAEVGDW